MPQLGLPQGQGYTDESEDATPTERAYVVFEDQVCEIRKHNKALAKQIREQALIVQVRKRGTA